MNSPEIKQYKKTQRLCDIQASKKYDYKLEDFDIVGGNWKHISWNTWMKGADGYAETEKIVKRYIEECNKPYGKRNLDFIHVAEDK